MKMFSGLVVTDWCSCFAYTVLSCATRGQQIWTWSALGPVKFARNTVM